MTLLELYNTWTDEEKKEALRDMKMDRRVELLSEARAAGVATVTEGGGIEPAGEKPDEQV